MMIVITKILAWNATLYQLSVSDCVTSKEA